MLASVKEKGRESTRILGSPGVLNLGTFRPRFESSSPTTQVNQCAVTRLRSTTRHYGLIFTIESSTCPLCSGVPGRLTVIGQSKSSYNTMAQPASSRPVFFFDIDNCVCPYPFLLQILTTPLTYRVHQLYPRSKYRVSLVPTVVECIMNVAH